ncbi:PREDICTED: neuronatin isoform X2 [Condylura cristata]|uniref:neuronatin isoform X2 n=1 Tax=Condylura cristata TaxID=143302 RepID=UPI000642F071|nr:PREDICTED: neuronatin isoform X2 [Condylura cristata]
MELRRRGSVWKEQEDYFSLSWRMRCSPLPPLLMAPLSAHAQSGSTRLLKARPPRLRQCAQQRTPRLADLGEPAASLQHRPTTLGTMAAVAAASAELLIIGWYIFRVLLQVFRYSLQKLAYTVSRTGRQVLGERRQRAPN